MRRLRLTLLITLALACTFSVRPVSSQAVRSPHVIRWYEAGGAAVGVVALMLADEPVQRLAQRNRSQTSDDIAGFVRHMGQPEVYVTTTVGLIGVGLLAKKPQIAKAGGRAAASLALTATVELGLKLVIGRTRPDSGLGAFHFAPFSVKARSLASGHAALSFALATSLAGEVRPAWVRVGLYGLATATALSRVNDDRHWLSDITAGSLIGFTSAKLVSGKWQVFGLKPPAFLVSRSGTTVGWSFSF